jgi:hypothetical protein
MFLGIGLSSTSGGSGRYLTSGRDYDGTNDYASRASALTGIADGKAGVISMCIRFDGGDGTAQTILTDAATAAASKIFLTKNASNNIVLQGRNAAGVQILSCTSSTAYTAGAAWLKFLCAWDLAAGVSQMYVDDASVKNGAGTQTDDTIPYTSTGLFAIGAGTGGATKLNGCLSEVFFHTTYLDISVEANRRKFFNAEGRPVNLGGDGSIPLGVQPLVYLPYGDPADNKGSGGNFTVTGALDIASTSPSD